MEDYQHYTKTSYSGRQLLIDHSLDEYGEWQIWGEDPNCDFGGNHIQPDLGIIKGTLDDVITEAIELPSFYTWGGGGRIVKMAEKDDVVKFLEDGEKIMNELTAKIELTEDQLKVILSEHFATNGKITSPVNPSDITLEIGTEYEDRPGGSSKPVFRKAIISIKI